MLRPRLLPQRNKPQFHYRYITFANVRYVKSRSWNSWGFPGKYRNGPLRDIPGASATGFRPASSSRAFANVSRTPQHTVARSLFRPRSALRSDPVVAGLGDCRGAANARRGARNQPGKDPRYGHRARNAFRWTSRAGIWTNRRYCGVAAPSRRRLKAPFSAGANPREVYQCHQIARHRVRHGAPSQSLPPWWPFQPRLPPSASPDGKRPTLFTLIRQPLSPTRKRSPD